MASGVVADSGWREAMLGAMDAMCLQPVRNVEAFRAGGQDEADVVGAHLQAATSLSAPQRPPVTGRKSSPR
jgi:hypothetical protein